MSKVLHDLSLITSFVAVAIFAHFFHQKKMFSSDSFVRPSVAQKPLKKAEAGDFFFQRFSGNQGCQNFLGAKNGKKVTKWLHKYQVTIKYTKIKIPNGLEVREYFPI
jgi:hypothetical protein